MVASCPSLLTEFELLGIAAEVGVERERDDVRIDIFRFELGPGEPPGTIRRAGTSRPAERAPIRGGKDHQRPVLGNGSPPCLGDIGQPFDLTPWALPGLRLDHLEQAIEVAELDRWDNWIRSTNT